MVKRQAKNFGQMELPMMMVIPSQKEENKQLGHGKENKFPVQTSAPGFSKRGDDSIYKSIASRYFKVN